MVGGSTSIPWDSVYTISLWMHWLFIFFDLELCTVCSVQYNDFLTDPRKWFLDGTVSVLEICASLRESVIETMAMIVQVFLGESVSCTQVFEWHSQFKAGQTFIDEDKHIIRPINSTTPNTIAKFNCLFLRINIEPLMTMLMKWELVKGHADSDCSISHAYVATKFVLRIVTDEQKQQHIDTCKEFLQAPCNNEISLSRVITGDERLF